MYAATEESNLYTPINGTWGEPGSQEALAEYVGCRLVHVYVIDADAADGPHEHTLLDPVRVLAHAWYDAGDDTGETPEKFACRLFEEAGQAGQQL